MKREADAIKLFAAISAAPRWVTALIIADGARFLWSDEPWWRISSAITALVFAIVETYAASYMMRSWRSAKGPAGTTLGVLWVSTLVILTAVMAPPIYANTMGVAFNTLPWPIVLTWTVCVASSTFLVIGGVGYADKLPKVAEPKEEKSYVGPIEMALATPDEIKAVNKVAKGPSIPSEGTNSHKILVYMANHPIATPTEVSRYLKIPLGTVKSIQFKARKGEISLGDNYDPDGNGDASFRGAGPDAGDNLDAEEPQRQPDLAVQVG